MENVVDGLEDQFGFKRQSVTREAKPAPGQVIEEQNRKNKSTFIAVKDTEHVFDYVKRKHYFRL